MTEKEIQVPLLNEEELDNFTTMAERFNRPDLDPSGWMTRRTVAEFWNYSSEQTVGQILRGMGVQEIKVRRTIYYNKEEVLQATDDYGLSPDLLSNKKMLPHKEEDYKLLTEEGLDTDKWVTYDQLCDYWGVSEDMIRQLMHRNQISNPVHLSNRGQTIHGRSFFYKPTVLAQYSPTKYQKLEREAEMRTLGTYEKYNKGLGTVRTQRDYIKRLAEEVTLDDWAVIVRLAVEDAKQGDRYARKWLSDYLIGTPIKRVAALVQETPQGRFTDEERAQVVQGLILGLAGDDGQDEDSEIIEGSLANSKETD